MVRGCAAGSHQGGDGRQCGRQHGGQQGDGIGAHGGAGALSATSGAGAPSALIEAVRIVVESIVSFLEGLTSSFADFVKEICIRRGGGGGQPRRDSGLDAARAGGAALPSQHRSSSAQEGTAFILSP